MPSDDLMLIWRTVYRESLAMARCAVSRKNGIGALFSNGIESGAWRVTVYVRVATPVSRGWRYVCVAPSYVVFGCGNGRRSSMGGMLMAVLASDESPLMSVVLYDALLRTDMVRVYVSA